MMAITHAAITSLSFANAFLREQYALGTLEIKVMQTREKYDIWKNSG